VRIQLAIDGTGSRASGKLEDAQRELQNERQHYSKEYEMFVVDVIGDEASSQVVK